MKEGIVLGKKVFLTDIIYKQLLNRFNTKKFVKQGDRFVNNDRCPLCSKYPCCDCPANISKKELGNCIEILDRIATPKRGKLFCNLITLSYTNLKGKKQIDRVHTFLLKNFKKWRPKK